MNGDEIEIAYQEDADALDQEAMAYLAGLEHASSEERDEMLKRAVATATTAQDRKLLHLMGLALARYNRIAQAVAVFDRAAEVDTTSDIDRLNAAIGLLDLGQFELARRRLDALIGVENAIGERARKLRDDVEGVIQSVEREKHFAWARVASLRERILSGSAGIPDKVRLARTLLALARSGQSDASCDEPRTILEEVRALEPTNVEALELLVSVYLHTDDDEALNRVLVQLEKVAPESIVFEALEVSNSKDQVEAYRRSMSQYTDDLLRLSTGPGPEAAAALESLREWNHRFPDNEDYAGKLILAELRHGNPDRALTLARRMADRGLPTHELHFNLGQVFWLAGEPDLGRKHLTEAFRLARTEQERYDIAQLFQGLEGNDSG